MSETAEREIRRLLKEHGWMPSFEYNPSQGTSYWRKDRRLLQVNFTSSGRVNWAFLRLGMAWHEFENTGKRAAIVAEITKEA